MHVGYQRVTATSAVKSYSDLTVPDGTTHVELQADTQPVHLTLDDSTDPTAASGTILNVDAPPRSLLIADLRKLRFTRGAAADGYLNFDFINDP